MSFVHLHVRSEYSIIDSIVTIENLTQQAKEYKMNSVALTDRCNLFGMVKFYRAALKNQLKPIIGAEIWVASKDPHQPYYPVILLCQNEIGYRNLTSLISLAYQEGDRLSIPLVKNEWLLKQSTGLILISKGLKWSETFEKTVAVFAHYYGMHGTRSKTIGA